MTAYSFILVFCVRALASTKGFSPMISFPHNNGANRTLQVKTDKVDQGYPFPVYGPPTQGPPPIGGEPEVHIEIDIHKLVLKCRTNEPYEHIVWKRYQCPNEYLYTYGETVAEGALVKDNLNFDVRLSGHEGVVTSSLLLRHPHNMGGLFLCEAWPHFHSRLDSHPFNPNLPAMDVFIIGGHELVEECYHHPHPPPGFLGNPRPQGANRVPRNLTNHQGNNDIN